MEPPRVESAGLQDPGEVAGQGARDLVGLAAAREHEPQTVVVQRVSRKDQALPVRIGQLVATGGLGVFDIFYGSGSAFGPERIVARFVPEPSTGMLLALGILAHAAFARRRPR